MPPFRLSINTEERFDYSRLDPRKELIKFREPEFNQLLQIFQLYEGNPQGRVINSLYDYGVRYTLIDHTNDGRIYTVIGIPRDFYLKDVLLYQVRKDSGVDFTSLKLKSLQAPFEYDVHIEDLDVNITSWLRNNRDTETLSDNLFSGIVDDEEFFFITLVQ